MTIKIGGHMHENYEFANLSPSCFCAWVVEFVWCPSCSSISIKCIARLGFFTTGSIYIVCATVYA